MKGAVERIFRQNILIGWESLFSVKGEAVNQIAQILKSPAFVLQIFNILVLEDFGHKLISRQWSYWAWYKRVKKGDDEIAARGVGSNLICVCLSVWFSACLLCLCLASCVSEAALLQSSPFTHQREHHPDDDANDDDDADV